MTGLPNGFPQPLSPVVVFGGAGFVGTHLLKRLTKLDAGRVICVDLIAPTKRVAGVEYLQADIRDPAFIDLPVASPLIFNLAAIHTTPGHEAWEYYATNVTGAVNVVRFARKTDAKCIVFTSSISVYGPDEIAKDETTRPAPQSDYGRSKLMAETIHQDWEGEDQTRRLVIVRPAVVFGAGENGNFTRLARILRKGFFVFPGRRDTIKSCIYVETLIDWILHALSLEERGIVFNGTYSNRYTIEQIVDTFQEIAILNCRKVMIPPKLLLFAAAALRPVSSAGGFGIHPERITKLMVSTNILPTWAEGQGLQTKDGLRDALSDWITQTGGRFD